MVSLVVVRVKKKERWVFCSSEEEGELRVFYRSGVRNWGYVWSELT